MSLISKYSALMQEAFGNDDSIARGDSFLDEDNEIKLKSEIPGISDEEWAQFVRSMITAPVSAVSPSNALGMFEMKPRRLADLGLVGKLSRTKAPSGRTVWTAVFVSPMTSDKFLKSPRAQYKVFSLSMRNYAKRIANGEIIKEPDMTLSGSLAILHKAGPNGLKTWKEGQRFPSTQAIHDRISGIF
jgi:hypothetical protein